MNFLLLLMTLCSVALAAPPLSPGNGAERARVLKDFLSKEKQHLTQRELERRDLLDELDQLNAEQNQVRRRLANITANKQELGMALDNLSIEQEKQKDMEVAQKRRLYLLLRAVYRIRKDGILRFIVNGEDLSDLAARVRVLYRTLRAHSSLTRQFTERADRLAASEKKVSVASDGLQSLLEELHEQEGILAAYQKKKQGMLKQLNQKLSSYQIALKEYQQLSSRLSNLFDHFDSARDSQNPQIPARGTLPTPVQTGHIAQGFGRSIHEQFRTVTYQKGIEIEADYNTPVTAILPGLVEFEGWVKGLGNVVIVHHGGGFYSISAHLFQTLKGRGTKVEQGETLGLVGDTGNNDKPSLYFEVRENGKAVDPLVYFSPRALRGLQ